MALTIPKDNTGLSLPYRVLWRTKYILLTFMGPADQHGMRDPRFQMRSQRWAKAPEFHDDPDRAADISAATERDREHYLRGGMREIECRACHACVLVKKTSPFHTRIQDAGGVFSEANGWERALWHQQNASLFSDPEFLSRAPKAFGASAQAPSALDDAGSCDRPAGRRNDDRRSTVHRSGALSRKPLLIRASNHSSSSLSFGAMPDPDFLPAALACRSSRRSATASLQVLESFARFSAMQSRMAP